MQEARRLGVTPDDKIATLLQLGPELEGLYAQGFILIDWKYSEEAEKRQAVVQILEKRKLPLKKTAIATYVNYSQSKELLPVFMDAMIDTAGKMLNEQPHAP